MIVAVVALFTDGFFYGLVVPLLKTYANLGLLD
jgi:hypothetical protein